MFFDSHCHLTCDELAPDLRAVLARAEAAGVSRVLNVADSLESAEAAVEQVNTKTVEVRMWATAGVHPQNALQFDAFSISRLRALASLPAVVAIGEIGLDFVYDETHLHHAGATRDVQQQVFREQLALARELDLPVVIHNRDADEAVVRIVGEYPGLRGVFHCFGSSLDVAHKVLELGFHVGFTGLVTFKNAESVREVARQCPLNRVLVETDAPYLAPVPYRGRINEPSYLPRVTETLANLHDVSVETMAATTTRNAAALFGVAEGGVAVDTLN